MTLIRQAIQSDERSVYDLITALMGFPLDREAFHEVFVRNLHSKSVLYYVAESDGTIVGFGSLHIELSLHHVGLAGEIQELVVHETVRSKGIGAELVSRLEEEAEKQGCVAIEVTTRKRWVDAQRFYKSVGFRQTHVNFTKELKR
ncbi:MAG: GNAT family N-acetyltransferase [Methanosarcinales archaeon]|nr:GNAT family N-acetyltransferase [Methanosarcinales archaeon]